MAKILIIDDDAGMRRTISRVLRNSGHEVIEAQDGDDGLQKFRATRPDIVVTDILMPEKEGIETILDLRREDPTLPIVAISGGAAGPPGYLGFALKLGADGVLTKPFRATELLREIDKLLPQ